MTENPEEPPRQMKKYFIPSTYNPSEENIGSAMNAISKILCSERVRLNYLI